MLKLQAEETKKALMDLYYAIAGQCRIVAACLYGPVTSGYADEKGSPNILLVLSGYQPLLKTHRKSFNKHDAFILCVDQGAFHRDVEKGWLGEFAADKLMLPYEPLINNEYLWRQEVTLKKRIVRELLEVLVLEYPELSHELSIKQEYFMHQTLVQRARLFPLVAYRFLNMFRDDVKQMNTEKMMKGYMQALNELARENWIACTNNYVKITPKFIKAVRGRRLRVPVLLKSVQRAAWLHLLSALPKMVSPLEYDQQLYTETHGEVGFGEDLATRLEEPKDYLLVPTPLGYVPLSDKTSIEEFVKKTVPDSQKSQVQTEQIGGVLNSVYLLTLRKDHEEQRVVVKKFRDWIGFKWFPLTLWALGTKTFAVLGRPRLEREYALNQYLRNHGVSVPKILYVSPRESLVFKEFVEGQNFVEVIKRVLANPEETTEELALAKDVGRTMAEAHHIGVALGDCKPENIIVSRDGTLYFVDLEQASRDGNQAWDVAEFLYYSGHYVPPLASTEAIESVAKAFIEGYLQAGGRSESVKKAASPRYTKVFSIFTQPHVILAVANLCRKAGEQGNSK